MAARLNYERKQVQSFNEDVKRSAFEAKITRDKIWQGSAEQDERVMNKRRARLQAEQAQEKEIEMRIKQAALVERQRELAAREMGLVQELERRKNEKLREEKVIEKVRAEAPELRELEQKLRAAYMNQERRLQLQEKVVMQEQEREREAIVDLQMEAARLREMKAEAAKEGQRRTEALAAKQILKEQMAEQDEAKAAAYAEFIKEKAMVDEIIAKIMEEEKQEALAKMAKRKETIEYVRNYLEENERLKMPKSSGRKTRTRRFCVMPRVCVHVREPSLRPRLRLTRRRTGSSTRSRRTFFARMPRRRRCSSCRSSWQTKRQRSARCWKTVPRSRSACAIAWR